MKPKYRIIAEAPSGIKVLHLRKFGAPQQFGRGVMTFNKVFNTEAEAIDYLKSRAHQYISNKAELSEAIADIEMYGSLTFDTITAQIEQTKTIH